jgi:large subunit ribosomal protein L21
MYAIFRSGDKQFRAEPGMTVRVPSIDAEVGETVTFGEVLLAGNGEDKKVIIFKWKRRKNYRRKQGHRQKFTEVRINEIRVG